jgi:integrase
MIKNKLTAKRIARAKPGRYADGGGLYLQVGENSASWLLRWERDRYERWHGLGSLRDVSLDEARDLARVARKLIKAGGDPIDQKRADRAAQVAARARTKTFGECATIFFEDRHKTWSRAHAAQWSSTVLGRTPTGEPVAGDYCKTLRSMPVHLIDVPMVLNVIRPLWVDKQETASRIRTRIEQVLDWARAAGLRTGDNPAALSILGNLLPKREKKSKRVKSYAAVPYAELPTFMADLRARQGSAARALEFTILTAARTNEALRAQWGEISFEDRLWTIPPSRMKAGKEHRQPLSDAAMELLHKLPREDGHPYLFVSAKPGKPLSDSMLLKTMRRIGREETAHGFRSTFSTWAHERSNANAHVIELSLAHSIGTKVEQAYRRTDLLDRRRRLLDQWGTYCTSLPPLVAGQDTQTIVPIRAAPAR